MIQIIYTGTADRDWVGSIDDDESKRNDFFDSVIEDIRKSILENKLLFSQVHWEDNPNVKKGKVAFLVNASVLPELIGDIDKPGPSSIN